MSTQNAQQPAQQVPAMDDTTAFATIFHGVHKRAYFHKLASLGILPQTPEEEQTLLELGHKLAQAENHPRLQSPTNNSFAKASAALDVVLTENGIPVQAKQAQLDEARQAAIELAKVPEIYNAAVVCKQAQLRQVQQPAA